MDGTKENFFDEQPTAPSEIVSTASEAFFYKLPKMEIHLHLEGMTSKETIFKLSEKYNVEGINSLEDVEKIFEFSNLSEFVQCFILVQKCYKKLEDLDWMISDAADYLHKNNIFYAEIHFAPSMFLKNGFQFNEIINVLDNGIRRVFEQHKIEIRLLIDVSRTFGPENAMKNLAHVTQSSSPNIIGIGLGGDEIKGPAHLYTDVFAKAQANGLKTVAHAGESLGPESIDETIKSLNVSRIGHAVSARLSEKTRNYLKETNTSVEVCPTSNTCLAHLYVKEYEDHPLRLFFDDEISLSLNSDDPSFFGVGLSTEYYNVHTKLGFTLPELLKVNLMTIDTSFASSDTKRKGKARVKRAFTKMMKEQT